MKKTLLSVLALATVAFAGAQNARVRGVKKYERKTFAATEASGVSLQVNPTQIPQVRATRGGSNGPVALGTYNPTIFAGSVNAFGSQSGSTNTLDASNTLGIITFTNRIARWGGNSGAFKPSTANSGWVYTKWSYDFGQTWDSTFVRSEPSSNLNLSRYPSGCLINPPGNTTASNAFIAACGPITTGAWDGNWFASTKLVSGWNGGTFTADNTNLDMMNGIDNEANQYFAGASMNSTAGMAFSSGAIVPGINNDDYTCYGARVNMANYDNGNVVWSFDSVNIDFVFDAVNTASESTLDASIAFNEDGSVGYVLMSGVENGSTGANFGYVPILFSSNDGGLTWSRCNPTFDWSTTVFQELYPNAIGESFAKPFFTTTEGAEAAVDAAGNLHYFTVLSAGSSMHPDSLGYTYTETGYNGLMFDAVFQRFTQTWCLRLIDTLYTNYASQTAGSSCNTENVWTTSTGKVNETARLQISRSEDGNKIFYIWTDTDTSIANFCNVYPDIYVKAYDIQTQLYTKTFSISQGDQSAYHMFASDKVLSAGGNYKLALTITKNAATNGDNPQVIYFINNAVINESAFTEPHLLTSYLDANSIAEPCAANSSDPLGTKETVKNVAVSVSPNPFTTSANLSVRLVKAGDITVNVYNNLGALVSNKTVTGTEGVNTVKIDGATLTNGIYFYNVVANNEIVKGSVVLTK